MLTSKPVPIHPACMIATTTSQRWFCGTMALQDHGNVGGPMSRSARFHMAILLLFFASCMRPWRCDGSEVPSPPDPHILPSLLQHNDHLTPMQCLPPTMSDNTTTYSNKRHLSHSGRRSDGNAQQDRRLAHTLPKPPAPSITAPTPAVVRLGPELRYCHEMQWYCDPSPSPAAHYGVVPHVSQAAGSQSRTFPPPIATSPVIALNASHTPRHQTVAHVWMEMVGMRDQRMGLKEL